MPPGSSGSRAGAGDRPGEPVLRLRGLTKRYGPRTAVEGLDLDLAPGEVLGFLGPNGSGKTTTVRVLLGMLRASAGSVRVLGQDPWRSRRDVHRDVGYVPGDVRLPSRSTVAHLLAHYGRLRGDRAEGPRAALADRLRLDLGRQVGTLSKGDRQKVALVQALSTPRRLLVLDEPTTGLDPLAREELAAVVREHAARGAGVLLSSHVLPEVERVADQVAVLRQGRLVALERLEVLRAAAARHVTIRVSGRPDASLLAGVPGVRSLDASGDLLRCTIPTASVDALVKAVSETTLLDLEIEPADLDELFLSFYGPVHGAA